MSKLTDQLERGAVPAGRLAEALRFSPQTLMRRVRAEGGRVVRIGRGRATRYGLRRELVGLGRSEIPLFRIAESGKPETVGRLVALAGGETVWLPAGVVFFGLPPEIADMQPSGFMGRAFPGQHADLPVPPRISDWSDDHTLIALARRGEDIAGNLILGDDSIERWFARPPLPVTRDHYTTLADAATAGEPAGSSAGGERPKFGAYVEGRHVLVKYAARGDSAAQRWQDLLILEARALQTLRDGGVAAANATIINAPTYCFLEVERFDRIGERGRRAAMTLSATQQDLSHTWARAASRLAEARHLSQEDAKRLKLYEAFARWIANVDRHHHNIVLFPEYTGSGEAKVVEPLRYTLAPAFDQVPMLYAPTSDGQLPERTFVRPTPTADTWDVWEQARSLAATFWQGACVDEELSLSMREIAVHHLEVLAP
jgi:hypothetical protein